MHPSPKTSPTRSGEQFSKTTPPHYTFGSTSFLWSGRFCLYWIWFIPCYIWCEKLWGQLMFSPHNGRMERLWDIQTPNIVSNSSFRLSRIETNKKTKKNTFIELNSLNINDLIFKSTFWNCREVLMQYIISSSLETSKKIGGKSRRQFSCVPQKNVLSSSLWQFHKIQEKSE